MTSSYNHSNKWIFQEAQLTKYCHKGPVVIRKLTLQTVKEGVEFMSEKKEMEAWCSLGDKIYI